jgi:hypothetical protein
MCLARVASPDENDSNQLVFENVGTKGSSARYLLNDNIGKKAAHVYALAAVNSYGNAAALEGDLSAREDLVWESQAFYKYLLCKIDFASPTDNYFQIIAKNFALENDAAIALENATD